MANVNQSENTVAGHMAGRDLVLHSPRRTPITELNERYIAAGGDKNSINSFIEELQHYLNITTNGDIRPLAQKLTEANRTDAIQDGELLKEKATKLIVRFQTSRTAQEILSHILGELFGRFILEVKPSIQAGEDRVKIDRLFSDKVIGQTFSELEANVLGLRRPDLIGLMYFLTGNCHVRWDRC